MGNRYEVHTINSQQIAGMIKDADGEDVQTMKTVLMIELVPVGHPGGSIRELVSPKSPLAALKIGDVVEHQGWKVVSSAVIDAEKE